MTFTGDADDGDNDPAFKVSLRLRTFPITKKEDEEKEAPDVKVVYVEVEEEFIIKRKSQLSLTVLSIVAMLGILLGILVNCSCGKKPETAKQKKVQ